MVFVLEFDVITGALKLGTDAPPDSRFTVPVGVTMIRFAVAVLGDEHVALQTKNDGEIELPLTSTASPRWL
jgi:hypothetical protein